MKIKHILMIVLIIAVIIIVIQNSEQVSLTILFWNISMSKIIFYPLLFVVGFLVGVFTKSGSSKTNKGEKVGVIREY
ncbi:MAG: DUF1049 domain-containing protein [Candidatus Cloacimonetes bacterium]|nr:DUF1049 domain-containing protein [Candidatus Cloacimonadota bacterium]